MFQLLHPPPNFMATALAANAARIHVKQFLLFVCVFIWRKYGCILEEPSNFALS